MDWDPVFAFLITLLLELGWVLGVRFVMGRRSSVILLAGGMQVLSYVNTLIVVADARAAFGGTLGAMLGAGLALLLPEKLLGTTGPS